jgi:molybdopterin synthase sulfur carrier subunit
MIQVVLPVHLRSLAGVDGPLRLEVVGTATQRTILDAVEASYPVLRGTIRDRVTLQRRAFVRFFACGQDVSLDPDEAPLPEAIAAGKEPFLIIGAIAGG